MNVILEGIDKSGKSTLCKWFKTVGNDFLLENNFKNKKSIVTHFTADNVQSAEDFKLIPGQRVFDQFLKYLKTTSNLNNVPRIWDRFFYSDYIYGPVYKNFGEPITLDEISILEKQLLKYKTCVIFCDPVDKEKQWNYIENEGLEKMTKENFYFFKQRLHNLIFSNKSPHILPSFLWDWQIMDINKLIDFLVEMRIKFNLN